MQPSKRSSKIADLRRDIRDPEGKKRFCITAKPVLRNLQNTVDGQGVKLKTGGEEETKSERAATKMAALHVSPPQAFASLNANHAAAKSVYLRHIPCHIVAGHR